MQTNNFNVPLSLHLWLLGDTYDHSARDDKTFSATELLKSTRQIILARRAEANGNIKEGDVVNNFSSRLGQSVHATIEYQWKRAIQEKDYALLEKVGLNKRAVDSLIINPTPQEVKNNPDSIFVYSEVRKTKELAGFRITGELDFCFDGQLEDFKSTKTYSYTTDLNEDKYAKQGSIYSWLFDDIVTSTTTRISFLFTDYRSSMSGMKDYPPAPVASKTYDLMTKAATEMFLRAKLKEVSSYMNTPEPDLPECTEEELMARPFTYAYYSKPDGKRATAVCATQEEASAKMLANGGQGKIEIRGGEVLGCLYCSGFNECSQKNVYLLNGRLKP